MEGMKEERGKEERKRVYSLWVYCILGINKQIHCGNIGIFCASHDFCPYLKYVSQTLTFIQSWVQNLYFKRHRDRLCTGLREYPCLESWVLENQRLMKIHILAGGGGSESEFYALLSAKPSPANDPVDPKVFINIAN